MKPIKFALIQSGYCVFGAGHTREECLNDASEWLEPDENGRWTPERIERELLSSDPGVHGNFYIIDASDIYFGGYLRDQGGYVKRNGQWFAETAA